MLRHPNHSLVALLDAVVGRGLGLVVVSPLACCLTVASFCPRRRRCPATVEGIALVAPVAGDIRRAAATTKVGMIGMDDIFIANSHGKMYVKRLQIMLLMLLMATSSRSSRGLACFRNRGCGICSFLGCLCLFCPRKSFCWR